MRRSPAALLGLLLIHAAATARAATPTKDECINANEEAQGLRKGGKLRHAREDLLLCTAPICPGPIRLDCAEQLAEVEAALPTLVLEVRSGSGGDVTAVRATMDGAPLEGALDGRAITLDPGPHSFVFEADGFVRTEVQLVVREGDKLRREPVSMSEVPKDSPPPSSPTPAGTGALRNGPASADPGAGMRNGALVAFGVGAAGVAVGAIFGILAMDNKSTLSKTCTGEECPAGDQGDLNSFRANGLVSDVGFGIGAAGLVAGGVLFLMSRGLHPVDRSGLRVVPWVGLGNAGLVGTFE